MKIRERYLFLYKCTRSMSRRLSIQSGWQRGSKDSNVNVSALWFRLTKYWLEWHAKWWILLNLVILSLSLASPAGFGWNLSISWITWIKLGTDVHVPQRMNCVLFIEWETIKSCSALKRWFIMKLIKKRMDTSAVSRKNMQVKNAV